MRRRAFLAAAALPGCALAQAPAGVAVLDTAPWGFGGFSGAHLAGDGTLTVVSDRGRWWQAALDPRGPVLGPARHGALRGPDGAPLRGLMGDAEALCRLPDGTWLVAFERQHRIWRYRALDGTPTPFPTPPGIEAAPANGGIEALAAFPDGKLLALAEGLEDRAWLWDGARWLPRRYRTGPGLVPTDACALPGGGMAVLERDFSLLGGFRGRLARVADPLAPELAGAPWLAMPPDLPAENWEAAAAARLGGTDWLVLLSDDNQSPFQRTLVAVVRP